jgi:hypothetical protein
MSDFVFIGAFVAVAVLAYCVGRVDGKMDGYQDFWEELYREGVITRGPPER